jgi:DNA-binding NarL/FixJ family response regulator
MARALALVDDLLFGSRLQAMLAGAGHEIELIPQRAGLERRLAQLPREGATVLIIDLTDVDLGGVELVEALARDGRPPTVRTLGYYAHVDASTRERAERAGFDRVVPRSRMAREGAELVASLAAS